MIPFSFVFLHASKKHAVAIAMVHPILVECYIAKMNATHPILVDMAIQRRSEKLNQFSCMAEFGKMNTFGENNLYQVGEEFGRAKDIIMVSGWLGLGGPVSCVLPRMEGL